MKVGLYHPFMTKNEREIYKWRILESEKKIKKPWGITHLALVFLLGAFYYEISKCCNHQLNLSVLPHQKFKFVDYIFSAVRYKGVDDILIRFPPFNSLC